ncbi:MAG: DUF2589 domain-containing protein [Deltaproteobacteria bacterium]|nr:DUF2589 domain-containing protein [Deltaproteobacteria bacterium]
MQAEKVNLTLSQAILAPLDAVFKAQAHAARSFLNLVMQVGHPHRAVNADGTRIIEDDGGKRHYNMEFAFDVDVDGRKETRTVSVPALALLPIAPLAVEEASFKFGMRVKEIAPHRQMQESEDVELDKEGGTYNAYKRPWYLVSEPVSLCGQVAAPGKDTQRSSDATIEIEIKVGKMPTPAGLDKILTTLTQIGKMEPNP